MSGLPSSVRPSGLDDHDITIRLAQASLAPHLIMTIISRLCAETYRDPKTWIEEFARHYVTSAYPGGIGSDVEGRNGYAADLLLRDTALAMEDCRRPL